MGYETVPGKGLKCTVTDLPEEICGESLDKIGNKETVLCRNILPAEKNLGGESEYQVRGRGGREEEVERSKRERERERERDSEGYCCLGIGW